MKSNAHDYLKYWKVIRQYVKVKYGLTQSDLDMLLFLYSEKYFNKAKFDEFDALLSWDKCRFESLREKGWIVAFRTRAVGNKAIYQLTVKSDYMIKSIYRKLSGEEIPVSPSQNKMFAKNVSYLDKVYQDMIKRMNAVIKQQRHLSQK
jgi:hypothetical protein